MWLEGLLVFKVKGNSLALIRIPFNHFIYPCG